MRCGFTGFRASVMRFGVVVVVGRDELRSIVLDAARERFEQRGRHFGIGKHVKSDCTGDQLWWVHACIESVQLACGAVMKGVDAIAQLMGTDRARLPLVE